MPLRSYLDGRVFADVSAGPGPLIVGLHGWGRDRGDLREALSGCAQLRVDLPGFGLSARPARPCGAAGYAACLAAVLDEHGRDQRGPAGPAGVMREVLVTLGTESYDAQLRAIITPVALLWGGDDQVVPASVAGRAGALLAGPVTAEIVDGAGHDVHRQAPARLGAAIGTVLAAGRVRAALSAGPGWPEHAVRLA